ncbi:oxamate carbamoyltransferase subunit AllH family protein, partial [Mesorhizobium xinjiangense]|uniref:oxamate carbamoyltransferase subunit AllH family protein n=1 Tax=Mesorhizobium xinjiangense TaxID=2678685 RepID=UPI0012EE93E4
GVRQYESFHPKLESCSSRGWNPESQQALERCSFFTETLNRSNSLFSAMMRHCPMIASAQSVGIDARRILRSGVTGHVAAVFERSIYLNIEKRWVCIGAEEIGRGPLNVPCGRGCPRDWRHLTFEGHRVSISGETVMLGGKGTIGLAAPVWHPARPPVWSSATLAGGLEALENLLPAAPPAEGLGCYARQSPLAIGLAARAAGSHISVIRDWLDQSRPTASPLLDSAVGALLGLGPGLTPSGDDFLAGLLAALRIVGRQHDSAILWRIIVERGPAATHPISLAHLTSAAEGRLAERLHHVIDAILAADISGLGAGLDALCGQGHSSPWDALAGIAVALRT